ncbi:hypothetical protein Hanom_Chr10g00895541 [Helianthus anomalus]
MSLSTPQQPSPQIPPTIIPLFDAIDIQTRISPSHSPIIESTLPQMTESEQIQSAIPQTTEEATPLSFKKLLVLDSGYILKTPLKETTVEATIVSSAAVGSP